MNELAGKVAAENLVNQVANAAEPMIKKFFAGWVGKKFRAETGGLFKATEKAIRELEEQIKPMFPGTTEFTGFRYLTYCTYRLDFSLTVNVRVEVGGQIYKGERTIMVAKTPTETFAYGQVIGEINPPEEPRKTDYKVQEIQALISEAEEAKKAWEDKRWAVPYFAGYRN